MTKIRPRIDDKFIVEIRQAFPTETALMGNEQVIEWGLEMFLRLVSGPRIEDLTVPRKGGMQDGDKAQRI